MVLAAVLGAVFGCIAVIPLLIGSKRARYIATDSNVGYTGMLLLILLVSLLLLIVPAVVCGIVNRPVMMPFVLGEAVLFVIGVLMFGFVWSKRLK